MTGANGFVGSYLKEQITDGTQLFTISFKDVDYLDYKKLFEKIKASSKGGDPGEWSARKAQLLASEYKKSGGGYKTKK